MSGKDNKASRWEILVEPYKVCKIENLVWAVDKGIVTHTFRPDRHGHGLAGLLFYPSEECKLIIILKFSPVDITFGLEINF
jgi:hypothetical protein